MTWLTALLAGDAHCEWATWFRAHNTYTKRPSDFNLTIWKSQHSDMVRTRAASLKAEGYSVYLENQNKMHIEGRAVTLGGCPDIIAVGAGEGLIVDCKTGQQRDSDVFQVMVYMLALPLMRHAASVGSLRGEVQYRDHVISIPPDAITLEFRERFRNLMARISAQEPATKVPSYHECRFCDIGPDDCPERTEAHPGGGQIDHDLF